MKKKSTSLEILEIRQNIKTIAELLNSIMKAGEHYGVITDKGKNSLWKAGAEKILVAFKIAPEFTIENRSGEGFSSYLVKCKGIYRPDGTILGEAAGSCSSLEEKFKWRVAVCDEEFQETPENLRRKKWVRGSIGKTPYTILQIRSNSDDVDNTILKMACKRAMIAMVLIVTAASDIFVQDYDDLSGDAEFSVDGVNKNDAKKDEAPDFFCATCNKKITSSENKYSLFKYKKPLCMAHQRDQ